MPDQIEQELRAALSRHAAQLDPDSITRLRTTAYHERVGLIPRILRSLVALARRRRLPPR
jgi:hypothetical protein